MDDNLNDGNLCGRVEDEYFQLGNIPQDVARC